MNISDIFTYYGLFSLVIAFSIPLLAGKSQTKLIKKHGKLRKNIFTTLAFIGLLLLWASIENAFSENTMLVLWSVHALLFFGYIVFSGKKYFEDKTRIQQAEARRIRREKANQ